LWTRPWDEVPLPDLSMTADDAATVILQIIAVSDVNESHASIIAKEKQSGVWPTAAAMPKQGLLQPKSEPKPKPKSKLMPMEKQSKDKSPHKKSQIEKMVRTSLKRRRSAAFDGNSDSDVSQGGPFGPDEDLRRQHRADRFKEYKNDDWYESSMGFSKSRSTIKAEARRARMLAKLQQGEQEEIDWDAFAIKVRMI